MKKLAILVLILSSALITAGKDRKLQIRFC